MKLFACLQSEVFSSHVHFSVSLFVFPLLSSARPSSLSLFQPLWLCVVHSIWLYCSSSFAVFLFQPWLDLHGSFLLLPFPFFLLPASCYSLEHRPTHLLINKAERLFNVLHLVETHKLACTFRLVWNRLHGEMEDKDEKGKKLRADHANKCNGKKFHNAFSCHFFQSHDTPAQYCCLIAVVPCGLSFTVPFPRPKDIAFAPSHNKHALLLSPLLSITQHAHYCRLLALPPCVLPFNVLLPRRRGDRGR